MAQRDEIILTGEKVRLPEHDLPFDQGRRLYDNKDRFPVGLQFWALMSSPRILHGKFMQSKLLLHFVEQRIIGFVKSDPEEYVGLLDNFADIVNRKGFKTLAVLICDAIYNGGLTNITRRGIVALDGKMKLRTSRHYPVIIAV